MRILLCWPEIGRNVYHLRGHGSPTVLGDPYPPGTEPCPPGRDPYPLREAPPPWGETSRRDPYPLGIDPYPPGRDPYPPGGGRPLPP